MSTAILLFFGEYFRVRLIKESYALNHRCTTQNRIGNTCASQTSCKATMLYLIGVFFDVVRCLCSCNWTYKSSRGVSLEWPRTTLLDQGLYKLVNHTKVALCNYTVICDTYVHVVKALLYWNTYPVQTVDLVSMYVAEEFVSAL